MALNRESIDELHEKWDRTKIEKPWIESALKRKKTVKERFQKKVRGEGV